MIFLVMTTDGDDDANPLPHPGTRWWHNQKRPLSVALTAETTLAVSTNNVIEDDFGSGDLAHVVQAKGNLATATDTDIHLGSGTNDIPTYSLDSGANVTKGQVWHVVS